MKREKNKSGSTEINQSRTQAEKSTRSVKAKITPSEATQEKMDRAAELFVSDLIIRGEAAKTVDGKLPPGATHEIVEENEHGLPTVRRRRFSAF